MKQFLGIITVFLLLARSSQAETADIQTSSSIYSFAVNHTQNVGFTNSNSGEWALVAVTMTAYSASSANPSFTLLDLRDGIQVHFGVESGLGSGDGNWIDSFEGANFSATLVSASANVITNSVCFGIQSLGIRPDSLKVGWTSSATNRTFNASSESMYTLETNTAQLTGGGYAAQFRELANGNRCQLSDLASETRQGLIFHASFIEGNGQPVITQNPAGANGCADSGNAFYATAVGDPTPAVQWQSSSDGGNSFTNITGGTQSLLIVAPTLGDNGNQYRAVFSNYLGTATTTAATMSVFAPPATPVINLSSLTVCNGSGGNVASAPDGLASYGWVISNGTITTATNAQTILYTASGSGYVTLGLTVGNVSGCTSVAVTNIQIFAAPDATFTTGSTNLAPGSTTNVANAMPGMSNYAWSIDNGAITSGSNGQNIIYTAGTAGFVTLKLITANDSGCTSTNISRLSIRSLPGIYVSDDSSKILKFDTNGYQATLTATDRSPNELAFDKTGNLFVANYDGGTIQKITTNGEVSVFSSGHSGPTGLAFDAAGNLFMSDYSDNAIWKFTPAGAGSIFANTGLDGPSCIAFDQNGYLYVANYGDGTIVKFDSNGNETLFTDTLSSPYGMAFDQNGNLFVADTDDNAIYIYDTIGNKTLFSDANLDYTTGLAFDGDGNLYASNDGDGTIVKFTPNGSATLFATDPAYPENIAIWPLPPQLIPPPKATLSAFSVANNQYHFTVTGVSGSNYVVQATANLTNPSWSPIATNSSPFQVIDTDSHSFSQRFYRVVLAQ